MNAAAKDLDVAFSRVPELGNELLLKLDALRDADPIYWSELNHAWIVTGHAEVAQGYGGAVPLSNRRLPGLAITQIPPEERPHLLPNIMNATQNWLLNMDAPEHPRLRKLLVKAFGKPIVEGLRPYVRNSISQVLDAAAKKSEVEFVEDIARTIPARTILRQLGLSEDLIPRLHHWSVTLNSIGGFHLPREVLLSIEKTLGEMRDVFRPEFARRRLNPTDDFLSALVTANEAGDQMSEDEMFATCDIVLVAGHDTSTNTMSLGAAALAKHPEACEYIRRHPENAVNIVMELSRLVAMSTAQVRRVERDFTWNGHELKTDQFVILAMGAANRDPKVFPNPEQIDFTRPQDQNLIFAGGAHHCIGHLLAKMQLGEFFPELVRRFDLELLDTRLDFGPTPMFRGLNSLRMRLHPRT